MNYMNFFSHEQFSPRLIIFTEGYSMVHRFTIGCIIGDEKIMIIDAGLGMTDNFRSYIESVVGNEKPFILACTHLHPDHAGSAIQFEDRYVSHLDQNDPRLPNFAFNDEQRMSDLEDFALESKLVIEYCKKHGLRNNRCEFKDIRDGDIFDLGGVKIEAIGVPGHSPGSMAFLNREEKYCFTGDAINTDTHLKKLDREGFRRYKKTMENFIERVGDDEVTIYPAHLPLPMTMEVPKNLVRICQELIDDKVDRDPPGETIFRPRRQNRAIRMHFYNNTCIVYNRDLLRGHPTQLSPELDFYSHEKWTDRIYTITVNPSMVNRITFMVIVGDEKILCIDSGHGVDHKLPDYIRRMTGIYDRPILLACTHVGIDHAGGAIQFDEWYVHPADWPSIDRSLPFDKRLEDVQPFAIYNEEFYEYTKENLCEMPPKETLREMPDGTVFDLGGIEVIAMHTPGHTPGHTAFYIPSAKIAFTGDAMNVDTHLKGLNRQGMWDYADMLEAFMKKIPEDTVLFSSHLNRPNEMRVPRNIAAACREIAAGQTWGDPPGEAIQKHISAFNNPDIKMHYHGNCCVVYNSALLDK